MVGAIAAFNAKAILTGASSALVCCKAQLGWAVRAVKRGQVAAEVVAARGGNECVAFYRRRLSPGAKSQVESWPPGEFPGHGPAVRVVDGNRTHKAGIVAGFGEAQRGPFKLFFVPLMFPESRFRRAFLGQHQGAHCQASRDQHARLRQGGVARA
jgi:hypothetical protein